jgi:hypothetical protein
MNSGLLAIPAHPVLETLLSYVIIRNNKACRCILIEPTKGAVRMSQVPGVEGDSLPQLPGSNCFYLSTAALA